MDRTPVQQREAVETSDGGATLTDATYRITPELPGGLCGLWAVDATTAYGVGQFSEPAYFVKTTNGGKTWTSRSMTAHAGSLVDVYFRDADHGIAVGGTSGTRIGGPGRHPRDGRRRGDVGRTVPE